MRKNNLLFLLFSAFFILPVYSSAENEEATKAKMNEIKLSEDYLYGEDFSDDKNIAFDNALSQLQRYANELRQEKGLNSLKVSDIQPQVSELHYLKGDRYTVLVYISAEKMFAIHGRTEAILNQNSAQPSPDPVQTPVTSAQPSPAINNSQPVANNSTTLQQSQSIAHTDDDMLDIISAQDTWIELKGFLTNFKKLGKIKETGTCINPSDVPADAFSILIDELYGVLAVLSPKNSANRINHKTNQTDSESNYPNCKVIVWYK
ncbi:MAG: hypothetical protein ACI30M_04470 [Muribaculaceae bacterium]